MTSATMRSRETSTGAEAEIRSLIDGWLEAVRSKDVGRIMAFYDRDVVAFDAIGALRFVGADAYGRHWEACMTMCPGETTFDMHDLKIDSDGDLAVAHALHHCSGTNDKGETQGAWMRMTACYRKVNGRWLIAHEHFSAPFDPESGKAAFDLTP